MPLCRAVLNSLGHNLLPKIKDLPSLERPREKALRYGIESLSNHELLAIIINSGTTHSSAIDIAYAMLSECHGLFNLVKKPFPDLINYKGIGKEKALKISATFEVAKRFNTLQQENEEIVENSEQIFLKYAPKMSFLTQEEVHLIILNKKKKILHEVNLFKGTSGAVNFSVSQIIREIIIHEGSCFYLIHNHPSGNVHPSEDDAFLTSELIRECKKVNVLLLDHLIIAPNQYFSFKDSKITEMTKEKMNLRDYEKENNEKK